jgi:hypothetical protein
MCVSASEAQAAQEFVRWDIDNNKIAHAYTILRVRYYFLAYPSNLVFGTLDSGFPRFIPNDIDDCGSAKASTSGNILNTVSLFSLSLVLVRCIVVTLVVV